MIYEALTKVRRIEDPQRRIRLLQRAAAREHLFGLREIEVRHDHAAPIGRHGEIARVGFEFVSRDLVQIVERERLHPAGGGR